jgi:outer membrane protein TolC
MAVIVELLGAETAHTQARANEVQARRDVALADAGLDLALGRPIRATGE